jgi:hypothetical protein
MKRLTAVLVLVSALAACTPKYAKWPYRGPMLQVRNPTQNNLVVLVRDGAGRQLVTAKLKPNEKHCFRWPFIHEVGYLMVSQGRDTVSTQSFEPWSADGWEWSGQYEPVANKNVCR